MAMSLHMASQESIQILPFSESYVENYSYKYINEADFLVLVFLVECLPDSCYNNVVLPCFKHSVIR